MDMEIDDLCLDFHPIKGYLLHKLNEVTHLKEDMKATVRDLRGFIDKLQNEPGGADDENLLEIGEVWKRIYNGKYVFGIEVKNISDGDIGEIICMLQWKSAISSICKTLIHSPTQHEFIQILRKQQFATVVLVINQIDFSRYCEYDANCKLFYQYSDKQYQALIPKFTFNVNDFGMSSEVQRLDLEVGGKFAILSAMAAQNQIALVARFIGNNIRKMDNYLTIDCMLRVAEFDGSIFVFERISDAVNKSVLKFSEKDGVYYMDIFYRDKLHLRHVLHHLHKNVKHLYILPRKFEEDLRKMKIVNNFGSQQFVSQILADVDSSGAGALGKSLLKQIEIVKDFHGNVIENPGVPDETDVTGEFNKIRNVLMQTELKTDIAFEKY